MIRWTKDPVWPQYRYGQFSVVKLNDRKRSNVTWLVEHDGQPVWTEAKLNAAKQWVERHVSTMNTKSMPIEL